MNENSGLNKNEVLIEIVDPGPCIPVLDIDVHISDLEIVLLPKENKNSLTLKTKSLGTAEAHINTLKICDSTCMVDVNPSEDFGQCNLFEVDANVDASVDANVENKTQNDKEVFQRFEESSNCNKQVLNIDTIEEFKNGNEENKIEYGDLSMKRVTKIFEKSNKNVLQNTVLKKIQNRVSDKTQDIDTECNKDGERKNVPLPFKIALIWLEDIKRIKKTKSTKKIFTVLTSEEWQQHHLEIQEEKLKKQREIEDKKKRREEAKKRKAGEKEAKRAAAEERKKLNEEIKKLMAKKKTFQKKTNTI